MSDEQTGDRDVLHSLPRTRPARRSPKRDVPAKAGQRATPAKATPRMPVPRAAAQARPARRPPPAPTRATAPPPSGYAVPEPDPYPRSTDLLTATAEAAVEIAQVGVTLGLRALRAALGHRPGADRP